MDTALKQISLEIPLADISFVEEMAMRMGWKMRSSVYEKPSEIKKIVITMSELTIFEV